MANKKTCSIDGCDKPFLARGWCSGHWTRWKRHGDPLGGGMPRGETNAFFDFALQYDGDECLIWPYAKDAAGYAQINFEGRVRYVHREVCIKKNGMPHDGMVAAHSCGKGHLGCVSPSHVRWATRKENADDMIEHGTRAFGENTAAAKLTNKQAIEIKSMKGSMTQERIAKIYGVSRQTISDIHTGRRWSWLT